MVYVSRSGEITEQRPWQMPNLLKWVTDIVQGVIMFFQTLIPFDLSSSSSRANRYGSDYRAPSGSSAAGGSSARRRFGGFRGTDAPSAPPCVGGG